MRLLLSSLVGLVLLGGAREGARADGPADPVRLIPEQADLIVQVEYPRRLAEAFTTLELVQKLQTFHGVREFYDSTNYRRFLQFVDYFERQLGARWPDLLDRLAGGGMALGVKLGPNPAPALLVIQSKDEKLLQQFVRIGLDMIEQELARQESKDRVERGKYREIEGVKIGNDFFAAQVGAALVISNKKEALQKAVDRHLDDAGQKKPAGTRGGLSEARKLLPENPLVWAWLNLETIKQAPQAREVFTLPRNDPNQTALFGGWLDVAARSPFLAAGFYRQTDGFLLTVRMPRGRDGMPEALSLHVPAEGQGSLPLLEPKNVLYSSSYFLDASKFWKHRGQLLNAQQVKGLEEFDKTSGLYLAGNRLSELLTQAGPHQRIVVAHQDRRGYQVQPGQNLPAFALVLSMREPDRLGRALEAVLRAAALLASNQVKLRLAEEKFQGVALVGYRFPEDVPLPADSARLRFNFSPCFAAVGDQFVIASTIELGRELIDLVQKEARGPRRLDPAAARHKLYSAGGAEFLHAIEDQLLAQTILDQALSPDEATREVKAFIELVRRLGTLEIDSRYRRSDFHYNIALKLGK